MTMAEVHVELSEDIVTVRRIASDKFRLEIPKSDWHDCRQIASTYTFADQFECIFCRRSLIDGFRLDPSERRNGFQGH